MTFPVIFFVEDRKSLTITRSSKLSNEHKPCDYEAVAVRFVMWYFVAVLAVTATVVAGATPCGEARTRCAYRTGCGTALSNYMFFCDAVLSDPGSSCSEMCGHALIALTSTEEGKELMDCECEEEYCMEAKQRVDICRPLVINGAANATSSCSLSQLICLADAQCATALQYYHQFCRSMFRGRKCSNKCLNSIEILRKQEKAAALTVCQCDGNEDYDCPKMHSNLARLCFHKHRNHTRTHDGGHGDKHRKVSNEAMPSGTDCVTLSGFLFISYTVFLKLTWYTEHVIMTCISILM